MAHAGDGDGPRKPKVSPDIYDGRSSLENYLTHFEMVARLNNWNEEDMAQFLLVSLRKEACQFLRCLPVDTQQNYQDLKAALMKQFGSTGKTQVHKAQLRGLKKRENETLPQLSQRIRQLVQDAYPELNGQDRFIESICLEHFIDALDNFDMQIDIFKSRPETLDDALTNALEYEGFNEARAMKQKNLHQAHIREVGAREKEGTNDQLQRQVNQLTQQMSELTKMLGANGPKRERGNFSNIVCFNCNEPGHISRNCSKRRGSKIPKKSTNY